MAYSGDKLPPELDTLNDTTIASGDTVVVGDVSDSNRAKGITWANVLTAILAYIDDATATLTNKVINAANNTITNISLTTGITGTLGIGNGGTGQTSASAAFGALKQDATTSATGVVELATTAETDTGTDSTRSVTPDGLSGSIYGQKAISIQVVGGTTDMATGDGKAYFTIPSTVGGMDLVGAHARVVTAGTTSTCTIQIANVTQGADMLSTKISIDSAETGSDTAATPVVIDTANDDVATNDLIRIDVDTVHTTPAKGLIVTLVFKTP